VRNRAQRLLLSTVEVSQSSHKAEFILSFAEGPGTAEGTE